MKVYEKQDIKRKLSVIRYAAITGPCEHSIRVESEPLVPENRNPV